MSGASLIDGKTIAAKLREEIKADVSGMDTPPGLAVILVGDDPASHVYVGNKIKACKQVGIQSFERKLPADSAKDDIAQVIDELNSDAQVHGILMQLPLPDALSGDQEDLVQSIAPQKDVDGLTVTNAGKLFLGLTDGLVPCTPQGSLHLIKHAHQTIPSPPDSSANAEPSPPPAGGLGGEKANLSGLNAVVIGRSNLFGKPMAQLLLAENCTVTTAHSRTQNLADVCRGADILVAAVGRPKMVQGDWIKPGAIVIDVGINRIDPPLPNPPPAGGREEEGQSPSSGGGPRLCGDVDFDAAKEVARAITPVPGGVGPMTIAYLLKNTVKAAQTPS